MERSSGKHQSQRLRQSNTLLRQLVRELHFPEFRGAASLPCSVLVIRRSVLMAVGKTGLCSAGPASLFPQPLGKEINMQRTGRSGPVTAGVVEFHTVYVPQYEIVAAAVL